MNTNNVYYAEIYRITKITPILDSGVTKFTATFSRHTLVYQRKKNIFFDLLGNKYLNCHFDYDNSEIGEEIVNINSLSPFNKLVNQNKNNLSKRKIKKIYNLSQKQD